MKFTTTLIKGKLIKRYKRFFTDIKVNNSTLTAHCPNTGSMMGLLDEGNHVWLTKNDNPNRKLKFTLEMIKVNKKLVGVNTHRANKIVEHGLKNKLFAYQLQDEGMDTVEANHKLGFPADLREYGIGAQILRECNVRQMRLLTNNPKKLVGLEGYNLEIIGREPIHTLVTAENKKYLLTKKNKLGHFINIENIQDEK